MNENDGFQNEFSGEKDQMIAHFQEVTSLDDIGQCLHILESANWNLDEAIQTYLANPESCIPMDPVYGNPSCPITFSNEGNY
jgi:hypothetical protein